MSLPKMNSTLMKPTVASSLKGSRENTSTRTTTSISSVNHSARSLIKTRAILMPKTLSNNVRNSNRKTTTTSTATTIDNQKPKLRSLQYNKSECFNSMQTFGIESPDVELYPTSMALTLNVNQEKETQTWNESKSLETILHQSSTITSSNGSRTYSINSKSLNSLIDPMDSKDDSKTLQKHISEYNLDYLNVEPTNLENDIDYGLLIRTLFRSMSFRFDESKYSDDDKSKSVADLITRTNVEMDKKIDNKLLITSDIKGTKRKRQIKREATKFSGNSVDTLFNLRAYDSMPNVSRPTIEQNDHRTELSANCYNVELPETIVSEEDTRTIKSITVSKINESSETYSIIPDLSLMSSSTMEIDSQQSPNSKVEMSSLEMLTPVMSEVINFKSHRRHRLRLSAHAHRSHRRHRTKRLRLSSASLITTPERSSTVTNLTSAKSDASLSSSSIQCLYQQISSIGRRFSLMSIKPSKRSSVDEIKTFDARQSIASLRQRECSTTNSITKRSNSTSIKLSKKSKSLQTNATQQNKVLSSGKRQQSLLRHSKFHINFPSFRSDTRPTNLIQEIYEHRTGVNCLELSDDRSLLVSGGEDGVLRLWSTFSTPCECIAILVGHLDYITCCAIYKHLVISGSADTTLKIWSIVDGNCLRTLKGHTAFVNRCTCFGPLLLSSSFDCTARVWSLTDELTLLRYEIDRQSILMKFDEDEDDETFSLTNSDLNVGEQELINLLRKKAPRHTDLVISQKLDIKFGECLHELQGHVKSVTQVAVASNDQDGRIEQGIIHEVNNIIITASADGTARTWSLATGELRHVLVGHNGPINCLLVDPNDPQIAYTAGLDHEIKCWDIITGEHLRDLIGHQDSILCLLVKNRILYSGSSDSTVRAWAMEFGQNTRTYYCSTGSITSLQYFDGIRSKDGAVRLYDANSAVLKQTFVGHSNAISDVRVVPGRLFTTSSDGKILVWDCAQAQTQNKDTVLSKGNAKNSHKNSKTSKQTMLNYGESSAIRNLIFSNLKYISQSILFGNGNKMKEDKLYSLYPSLDREMSLAQLKHDHSLQDIYKQIFKQNNSNFDYNKKSFFSLRSLFTSNTTAKQINKCWQMSTRCLSNNNNNEDDNDNNNDNDDDNDNNDSNNNNNRFDQKSILAQFYKLSNENIEQIYSDWKRMPLKNLRIIEEIKKEEEKQEDSENLRRAITSLEPYIRSFH